MMNNENNESCFIDKSVNGKTRVFGLIGNPVEHTFSPPIQNTFAAVGKFNFKYVPFNVKPENLEDAVKGAFALGIEGLNVTVPHKQSVIEFLCGVDERAAQIGAVNTLKITEKGYFGYNTDIIGILYSLRAKGISIKGKNVLIIGAGGSARAAAVLAASENAESLVVANRTVANAQNLVDNIKKFYDLPVCAVEIGDIYNLDKCDIVIQTTTVGFGEAEGLSPVEDYAFFGQKGVCAVFDTIYIPWKTKFLEDAENCGVIAVNGFDMLIYQAVAAQEIWLETTYCDEVKEKLKTELARYYKNF